MIKPHAYPLLAPLALLWCALLLPLCAGAAPAASGSKQLHAFLDGLRTLRAEFDQTTFSPDGRSKIDAEGSFYLQRPGKFRWVYRKPNPQQIVADGSRVWLYDQALEQVSHQSEEKALRGTPALVLSDTGPIDKHFTIRDLDPEGGRQRVELIPKAQETEVARIELRFVGERIDGVEMVDAFGQVTRIRFSQVERNPALEASLFEFRPPPGIDILQSR